MSDVILRLPNHVINQISAGEVVQRPASVVKELLENAIDAKASSIKLIIKEAGKHFIQVLDDGVGMSFNDAKIAFERHSTSKIRSIRDIFSIHTKGFRGEALASILAVAKVELKTKRKCDELGTYLILEGGNLLYYNFVPYSNGSSFLIKNLFFNIPVRRKFLKSNFIEFKYIVREFIRIAISHLDVNLQLFHNDQEIYNLKTSNLIFRISELFGEHIRKFLVPIQGKTDKFVISGFVTKPEYSKKNKNDQFFFVNNRFFKSNYFSKAVLDAYEGILKLNQYPIFFIFIKIDSLNIDVNIHPTKTEVKFDNEFIIFEFLKNIIKDSLGIYNITTILDVKNNKEIDCYTSNQDVFITNNTNLKINSKVNLFKDELTTFINYNDYKSITIENEVDIKVNTLFKDNLLHLFRLQNGYWVLDELETLFLLDMYRIHQTVLYHRLLKNNFKTVSQKLIFPLEYSISKEEYLIFQLIKKNLFLFGFEIRLIADIVYFYSLPCDFPYNQFYDFFDELIKNFNEDFYYNFSEFYFKVFVKVSGKKKNKFLNIEIVQEIIKEFKSINMIKYNPFGKKNYVVVSFNELINQF